VEWLITNAIAAWLLPPGFVLLVLLGAVWLFRSRPAVSRALATIALVTLYALATPFVSDWLRHALEPVPSDPLVDRSGQAIVILSGGTYHDAPEYGSDVPGKDTLMRLRYGARLYRMLGKPLLVTGGKVLGNTPEAAAMKTVLESDFHVPVKWVEPAARTTLENARLSYGLLSAAGVRRIYLVTQAWHMPRARLAFQHYGFEVIPAATGYSTRPRLTLVDFAPNAAALLDSSIVFHEIIGLGWYHLRIFSGL
jgi:uncharacterized SAM-binding protein YcdF (DUF218 family)